MNDFRKEICAQAFKIVPGCEYNRTHYSLSQQQNGITGKTIFYELTLPTEGNWENFRDKTYPSLIKYLKYKRVNPESPKEAIIAVFFKDDFYLLAGEEFVKIFLKREGLNAAEFHKKVLQWLAEEEN